MKRETKTKNITRLICIRVNVMWISINYNSPSYARSVEVNVDMTLYHTKAPFDTSCINFSGTYTNSSLLMHENTRHHFMIKSRLYVLSFFIQFSRYAPRVIIITLSFTSTKHFSRSLYCAILIIHALNEEVRMY